MAVVISAETRSLSARYGIPEYIVINDDLRYSHCVAHEAVLSDVSDDGQIATYSGICPQRHQYTRQMEVAKLRRETKVVMEGGEYIYKHIDDKVHHKGGLEEY